MGNLGKRPVTYTEQQKTQFCELAQEVGIYMATKELNYPSYTTAQMWLNQRGIKYPKSPLQVLASMNNQAYTAHEMLEVGNVMLNTILNDLVTKDMSPVERKAMADSYYKTITTMRLLEGKANNISETVSKFDSDYQALIDEMEAKNAAKEQANDIK